MSAYKSAVETATAAPLRGYAPRAARPSALLVKVHSTIPTPHGPVIAGEVVEAQYFAPGEATPAEVGFSFKKLAKKVGRGVKSVAKASGRTVKSVARDAKTVGKLAVKYHPITLAAKGGFKVAKFTGKHVAKGSKKAVRWAKKNPVKALAIATGPLGLATYATLKGGKSVKRALSPKRKRGSTVPALGPMTDDGTPASDVPPGSLLTPEGQANAASLDAEEDSARMAEPESYPGEQNEDGDNNDGPPNVLEPPTTDDDDDDSRESQSDDDDEGTDDDSSSNDEESEVSGMADEEWVGLDEIAGEGDEWVGADEIGAVAKRRGVLPNAALVRKKGYAKKRRQPLGFNSSGTVAAGASATIAVVAQTLFRGRKLVVPAAIMASFTIDDIKVGNVSQFAASGSQSAEAFGPTTTGEDNVQMDTCAPGLSIFMTVTNTSGGALQFRATLFGDSVQ